MQLPLLGRGVGRGRLYCSLALLHKPLGGGGGTTDTYRLTILDEREVDLMAALDVV